MHNMNSHKSARAFMWFFVLDWLSVRGQRVIEPTEAIMATGVHFSCTVSDGGDW